MKSQWLILSAIFMVAVFGFAILARQTVAAAANPLPVFFNAPKSILLSDPASYPLADARDTDREALVALYNSTDGENWTLNTNWLSNTIDHCSWFGVMCDGTGRVKELSLTCNNLSGPIPGQLGNLSSLDVLELYQNQLSGPIPSELGNLNAFRRLVLYHNQLSDPIPSTLGNLTNLNVLSLHNNQLDGPIPHQLGNLTSLWYLSLSNNPLSGPIPGTFGNLTNLKWLLLDSNQLSGPIPNTLINLTSLLGLHLSNNHSSLCVSTQELLNFVNNTGYYDGPKKICVFEYTETIYLPCIIK